MTITDTLSKVEETAQPPQDTIAKKNPKLFEMFGVVADAIVRKITSAKAQDLGYEGYIKAEKLFAEDKIKVKIGERYSKDRTPVPGGGDFSTPEKLVDRYGITIEIDWGEEPVEEKVKLSMRTILEEATNELAKKSQLKQGIESFDGLQLQYTGSDPHVRDEVEILNKGGKLGVIEKNRSLWEKAEQNSDMTVQSVQMHRSVLTTDCKSNKREEGLNAIEQGLRNIGANLCRLSLPKDRLTETSALYAESNSASRGRV